MYPVLRACFVSERPAGCLTLKYPDPCAQIKEFSEPATDTAAKDQAPTLASTLPSAAPSAVTLDLPSVAVIPHALAKLEKPADEMYSVSLVHAWLRHMNHTEN